MHKERSFINGNMGGTAEVKAFVPAIAETRAFFYLIGKCSY